MRDVDDIVYTMCAIIRRMGEYKCPYDWGELFDVQADNIRLYKCVLYDYLTEVLGNVMMI